MPNEKEQKDDTGTPVDWSKLAEVSEEDIDQHAVEKLAAKHAKAAEQKRKGT